MNFSKSTLYIRAIDNLDSWIEKMITHRSRAGKPSGVEEWFTTLDPWVFTLNFHESRANYGYSKLMQLLNTIVAHIERSNLRKSITLSN